MEDKEHTEVVWESHPGEGPEELADFKRAKREDVDFITTEPPEFWKKTTKEPKINEAIRIKVGRQHQRRLRKYKRYS